jgi:hypothetical protein
MRRRGGRLVAHLDFHGNSVHQLGYGQPAIVDGGAGMTLSFGITEKALTQIGAI